MKNNLLRYTFTILTTALTCFVSVASFGQDLDVIAQARSDSGVKFTSESYAIDIKDYCEEQAPSVSCGDVEFIFNNKADHQTFELNGRSMNHRDETPSLFGYTASQLDTTYIILIQDQKFLIIRNGEILLEEEGVFTMP